MNGNRFLLDTNILLYITITGKKLDINALPSGDFLISFVTELEILSYPSLTSQEEAQIKLLLAEIPVIDITPEIKDRTVAFRRKYRLKLPDALIAATAFSCKATLITNDQAFETVREITALEVRADRS